MAAQLRSRGRGLPGAVRSAEVFKGPAFRQGRQRSYRGRISRSPGAQASGLPTASASAPPFGPIRIRHSRRNYSLSVRGVQVAATTIRLAAHHFLFGIPCVFTATSRSGRVYWPGDACARMYAEHTSPASTSLWSHLLRSIGAKARPAFVVRESTGDSFETSVSATLRSRRSSFPCRSFL